MIAHGPPGDACFGTTPFERTMLIETSPGHAPLPSAARSFRQDRLEAKLARVIAAGSPRSAIRDAVQQLVDQLRWQQIPASRGVAIVMDVVSSAAPAETYAFDAQADCLMLAGRWAAQRYARAG